MSQQQKKAFSAMSPSGVSHMPAETPPAVASLSPELEKIQQLLDAGRAEEALKFAGGKSLAGQMQANARAVCLLRLGKPEDAIKILRSLVLERDGLLVRPNASLVSKVNFATALAMSGNASGAVGVLNEIPGNADAIVNRVRDTIQAWEKTLSLWEWIQWKGGVAIDRPVTFPYPPGTLVE